MNFCFSSHTNFSHQKRFDYAKLMYLFLSEKCEGIFKYNLILFGIKRGGCEKLNSLKFGKIKVLNNSNKIPLPNEVPHPCRINKEEEEECLESQKVWYMPTFFPAHPFIHTIPSFPLLALRSHLLPSSPHSYSLLWIMFSITSSTYS